jgi:hypothetical protein
MSLGGGGGRNGLQLRRGRGSGEAYGTGEVDDLYADPDHWQGFIYVVTTGPHGVNTNVWSV